MAVSGRPAAFLDRDGTIIRDAHYIRDPRDVELLPGAAGAIRRLNDADIPVIVVTNQSGIARGLLDLQDYESVRDRIGALLRGTDAHITATYMCPHHPNVGGACDCRKPGLAMYHQAIADYSLDPARSLFVGDRWRDVAPGIALGGTAIMLNVESTPETDRERGRAEAIPTADTLASAVEQFLRALPR